MTCKMSLATDDLSPPVTRRFLDTAQHMPIGSVRPFIHEYFPRVQAVAGALLTTEDDLYVLDLPVFPWIPCPVVHKRSLLGALLTPILSSLQDRGSCPAPCPCRESLMQWFLSASYKAKRLGWTLAKMSAPQDSPELYGLLREALPDYLRAQNIDLQGGKERARCKALVDATHDDLLGDYYFSRVAFECCGGWLTVMGPPPSRADPSFLVDCLKLHWPSMSDERLEFLLEVEESLLAKVVVQVPRVLRCPSLQTKGLAVRVLTLDRRVAKYFRCSLRELPEVALLCGAAFLRECSGSCTSQLLQELSSAMSTLGGMTKSLGSKLRRAVLDLSDALSEGLCDEIEASCRKLLRLSGREHSREKHVGQSARSGSSQGVSWPEDSVEQAQPISESKSVEQESAIRVSVELSNKIAREARLARRGKGGMATQTFARPTVARTAQKQVEQIEQAPRRKERSTKVKISDKERLQTERFLNECRLGIEAAKRVDAVVQEDLVPEIERRLRERLVAAHRQEKRSIRLQRLLEARRRAQELLL